MSITYEEALETLEGMFGAPWERKTLDAVLRYHQGHMENTVDSILRHGEGTPETLIAQLKSGTVPQDQNTAMDEQLARQLSQQPQSRSRRAPNATATGAASSSATSSAVPAKKGRGTPTELPTDFLRIPGYQGTAGGGMDADEALARMLQDELFTQELANNPEFAHLARGRPRTSGGQPIRGGAGGRNINRVGELPSRTAGAPRRNLPGEEAPNIVEKLTGRSRVVVWDGLLCGYQHYYRPLEYV